MQKHEKLTRVASNKMAGSDRYIVNSRSLSTDTNMPLHAALVFLDFRWTKVQTTAASCVSFFLFPSQGRLALSR